MDENRRLFVLSGTVIVVALVVLGGYLAFRGSPEHTLTVRSIPSDLTLTLDGRQIPANGEIKVKEGTHTLTGERRGFQSYTQTVQMTKDSRYKMYLFSNSAEGRAWEKSHPGEQLEAESEAGRRFDELNARLQAKYPILQELPYIGPGFTVNQGISQDHPGDPEYLAFYIKITDSEGRKKALEWLTGHGYKPETLELIYTK
ncbi:PEGA domain-containing protein [Kribbella turkmenica]|uniref:PEGA domain-containing protein n=1 Tax=Kribbella turkmenica TaxID=2530375 RepID=A0A4R4XFB9_9ACTN|nr:PEGA domain-containing protein [Kribbella turkmenica]TDD29405.1 PEGA domain-containing protein [Kribbella turkmenica]